MKTITFRNGDPMPLFGLGTYQSKANELHDAIISALKDGYKLIDCAAYYKNEEIIGAALQETFTSGLVKREELFITSKLWNNNHAPEHVEEALRKTLLDLPRRMSPHGDLESDGTNAGKRAMQTYRGFEFQHPEIERTDRRGKK